MPKLYADLHVHPTLYPYNRLYPVTGKPRTAGVTPWTASCTESRSTRNYADLACRVMARLNRPIGAQPTSEAAVVGHLYHGKQRSKILG